MRTRRSKICRVLVVALASNGLNELAFAEDQVVSNFVTCTKATCSGYTIEFEENSNVGWDCASESACENTTFIVNSGSTLVNRLECALFDRACYNSKIIVRGSDLEEESYHLSCGKEDAENPEAACNYLNLSLSDSFLDVSCAAEDFQHVHAYLYGTSQLEIRRVSSLPSTNQLQVHLSGTNAVFRDEGIGPYVLYTDHRMHCGIYYDLQACNGTTIVFKPGSVSTWRCWDVESCANTTFIIESGSTIDYDMDCVSADRSCVGAEVVVHSSDLLIGHSIYGLDCDSQYGYTGHCDDMCLTLFDSRLRLYCRYDTCRNFKAFLYGNSRLEFGDTTSLSTTDLFEVTLFGSDAVFEDYGIGPYIIHYSTLPTTTLPVVSSTVEHSSTRLPTTSTTLLPTTLLPTTTPLPSTTLLPTTTSQLPTTLLPTTTFASTSKLPTTTGLTTTGLPTTLLPTTTQPSKHYSTVGQLSTGLPTNSLPLTSKIWTTALTATGRNTTQSTAESTVSSNGGGKGGGNASKILVVAIVAAVTFTVAICALSLFVLVWYYYGKPNESKEAATGSPPQGRVLAVGSVSFEVELGAVHAEGGGESSVEEVDLGKVYGSQRVADVENNSDDEVLIEIMMTAGDGLPEMAGVGEDEDVQATTGGREDGAEERRALKDALYKVGKMQRDENDDRFGQVLADWRLGGELMEEDVVDDMGFVGETLGCEYDYGEEAVGEGLAVEGPAAGGLVTGGRDDSEERRELKDALYKVDKVQRDAKDVEFGQTLSSLNFGNQLLEEDVFEEVDGVPQTAR